MGRVLKILMILATLIPAFAPVITGCASPEVGPQVGKLAPDFKLPSLDGQTALLRDFRGKTVLLNFWATWCPPCRAEMPFIQQMFEDKNWAEKGLVIIAVDIGESPATVRGFAESFKLSFLVLLDRNGDAAEKYNVRGIPATFFIDKEGIIREIKIGAFTSKAEIEKVLSKIIP